ncbi:pyridoxamine 5'-phosphate oxidase family protein [Candidatus Bathyarchaeota archaeon]|nr:MAG: pyridoxamine 5'-phosphate oxidase family protein [Candidatus Bathyarchaeota archaeon]
MTYNLIARVGLPHEDLSILQTVLETSLAKASSHSKKVYGKNPLTVQDVLDLANSRALTLAATAKPSGKPHLSPTDLVAVDERLYLGVDVATARYRNLKKNPAIAVMMADGYKRQAILEGTVDFLDMEGQTAKRVGETQRKKYGWVTDALAEFNPEKAFTWKL